MTVSVNPVVDAACSTSPPVWRTRSWVAAFPSSRVTRIASSTRSAASVSPMWRSIMIELRMRAVGLMTSLPACPDARSLMMSPLRFVVTITSNCAGFFASWWATLSMMRCSDSISG